MKDVYDGLAILLRYDPDGDFDSQHDQLFCGGPRPDLIDAADFAKLDDLGFFWNEEFESWSKFT